MRKILNILLAVAFLFLFQNCSTDEQGVFEENTELTEEFNQKMRSGPSSFNTGPVLEGCEIEYTFNDPSLTPAEKAAIRFSYGFFLGIKSVSGNTEIWYVDCAGFYSYNDSNPGGDENGTFEIKSGCPRGGCPTTPPKPDEPIGPFDNEQ